MVVLSQVLADEINVGYERLYNETIVSVNGTQPEDMASFVRLVDGCGDTLELRTSDGGLVVFDPAAAEAAKERIMERYRISDDRSANLR